MGVLLILVIVLSVLLFATVCFTAGVLSAIERIITRRY